MGFKPMQPPASLATDGLPAEIGDAGHNSMQEWQREKEQWGVK
jgi:hypothetical protein